MGIGANLGDKRKNLRQAVELIAQIGGVNLLSISHFYETEPWGVENQPNYINAAVKIETDLQPLQLLDSLQAIEHKLGRVRKEHWGARTIDIDILSIDGITMDTERLKLPHPYMFQRDFVLIPLSEVSGEEYQLHGDKVTKVKGCLVDFNLKLIACVDNNFGLGLNDKLLFHIDEDLKRFRELTINHTVVMGRKTFESIGKPLDNRRNIVLSRRVDFIGGLEVANSLDDLYNLLLGRSITSIFVIGGGEVYRQLIPYASEIYLTVVDESKRADTYFPNLNNFEEFICDSIDQGSGFKFKHYRRKI
ncbi:MAG: 2-amino-4-hydroxy-6-hydroxymethyldihydropteridine diphosphokinase [Selenomonadaceae bacterium]|nr:2-amino-4-hydroxy-6-hydroxymethyldihydropteridine diphosphokinase [Selenomonadaceae bacterium]